MNFREYLEESREKPLAYVIKGLAPRPDKDFYEYKLYMDSNSPTDYFQCMKSINMKDFENEIKDALTKIFSKYRKLSK